MIALGFLTTWVYVRSNRSILASILFHICVNLMQERIGLTPQTKCIETFVIIVVAVIVVKYNGDIFSVKLNSKMQLEISNKSVI